MGRASTSTEARGVVVPFRKRRERIWVRDKTHRFLVLHKPTGIYYVRAKKKGRKPLFKTTGYKTVGKAKSKAMDLLAEWAGDKRPSYGKTFRDAGEWVLKHHTPTQRIGTQTNHKIYIGQLIEIIGDMRLDDITPATLPEVIDSVKHLKRYSPKNNRLLPTRKTFSDYAKNLNLVMKHAYRNKWASHLVKFQNPDAKKQTGRLMSRAEVDALWAAMNEDTRDQFVLALECLMRLREAICAPWIEINLETGEWKIPKERVKTGSKTGKGRSFIVSPNALARLRARRARMPQDSYWVFPSPVDRTKPIWSIKTAWAAAKRKAGVKGTARWHDLRHTGLTWVLLGDPDLPEAERAKMIRDPLKVSEYAGVSMKTIQTVYLKAIAAMTAEVGNAISIF